MITGTPAPEMGGRGSEMGSGKINRVLSPHSTRPRPYRTHSRHRQSPTVYHTSTVNRTVHNMRCKSLISLGNKAALTVDLLITYQYTQGQAALLLHQLAPCEY